MQFVKNRLGILSLCLIITSACATMKVEEIAKAITQSQIYLDTVKESKAKELYPDDFREAEEKLNQAKLLNEAWFRGKKAYSYALESMEVSKRIMKKILIGQVRPDVEKTKEAIETTGRDTSLKDLIPKLNEILKYIDAVAKNEKGVIAPIFATMKEQSDDAKKRRDCTVDGILEDDVSFNQGRYKIEDIPEQGKQLLDNFVKESISARNTCFQRLKEVPDSKILDSKVVITISTFGYTDAQSFLEDSMLIEKLEEKGKCPQQFKWERQQCLNQRLSELRATAIGEYLIQKISESDPNIVVKKGNFIGRGEEIPEGVENPLVDDPRRRICIIESVAIIE
jgi:outer membrane protein OmpA-like peptidoglycan-associated protein